jgi:hypothetical protein
MLASRETRAVAGQEAQFRGYNPANVKFDKETQRLHVFAENGDQVPQPLRLRSRPDLPG